MADMQIRPATLSDLHPIQEITHAAYAKYIPRLGRKPQPMLADYAAFITAGEVWVALDTKDEKSIAGLIVLQAEHAHLLIYSVAVHPAQQRMGFGKQLLKFAEEQAAAQGYDTIQLYTNEMMVENMALYQRVGYGEVARAEYKGSQTIYMEKSVG